MMDIAETRPFQEIGFESMIVVGHLFFLVALMWFYVAFYRLYVFFNCFHLLNKTSSSIFEDRQRTWSKWAYIFLSQADMIL